jgi:hypothetical protein
VTAFTTAQLLEPAQIGSRFDRFEFELCNRAGARIGLLQPDVASVPVVDCSTDRAIMRTVSGLELTGVDVNIFTDRLRPVMVLQNGERFPLGFYVFGQYDRQASLGDAPWSPTCYDQAHLLDQKLDRSTTVPPGQSVEDVVKLFAAEVGILGISLEANHPVTAAEIAWPAGETRLKILNDLAKKVGCLPVHFDNRGILRLRPAPLPGAMVDHLYGPGRIRAQSTLESNDSYQAPNRWLVIANSADNPIIGRYDVPSDAPHSIANRGYVVAETGDATGITEQAAADEAARVQYLADPRTWQSIDFESLLDPRHDVFAVIRYEHDPDTTGYYLEIGSRMELRWDGTHSHKLSRLWDKRVG